MSTSRPAAKRQLPAGYADLAEMNAAIVSASDSSSITRRHRTSHDVHGSPKLGSSSPEAPVSAPSTSSAYGFCLAGVGFQHEIEEIDQTNFWITCSRFRHQEVDAEAMPMPIHDTYIQCNSIEQVLLVGVALRPAPDACATDIRALHDINIAPIADMQDRTLVAKVDGLRVFPVVARCRPESRWSVATYVLVKLDDDMPVYEARKVRPEEVFFFSTYRDEGDALVSPERRKKAWYANIRKAAKETHQIDDEDEEDVRKETYHIDDEDEEEVRDEQVLPSWSRSDEPAHLPSLDNIMSPRVQGHPLFTDAGTVSRKNVSVRPRSPITVNGEAVRPSDRTDPTPAADKFKEALRDRVGSLRSLVLMARHSGGPTEGLPGADLGWLAGFEASVEEIEELRRDAGIDLLVRLCRDFEGILRSKVDLVRRKRAMSAGMSALANDAFLAWVSEEVVNMERMRASHGLQ